MELATYVKRACCARLVRSRNFPTVVLLTIAATVPTVVSAQDNQWEVVEGLPADTRLAIERINREPILGEFQRATVDELFLRSDDRIVPVRRSEIRRVQTLSGRTVGRGARNGLIVGGIIGAVVAVAVTRERRDDWQGVFAGILGIGGGLGAGIGAIDGAFRPRRETIFDDVGAAAVRVAPIVTARARGVRVAFTFD